MNKRKKITAKLGIMLLLLAALAMIILPLQAWATENDTDNDGILNDYEGLCLPLAQPSYCQPTIENVPDLFIQVRTAPDSLLDLSHIEDYFNFITEEQTPFNINLHVYSGENTTAVLFPQDPSLPPHPSQQYAISLKEDTTSTDGDLGTTEFGVVSDRINGTVFTRRIMNDVQNACNRQVYCEAVNSQGEVLVPPGLSEDDSVIRAIFNVYLKNVWSHEAWHGVGRVVPPDNKLEHHYRQIGKIMDHHMWYKESKKLDKVTWHIETTWTPADTPQFNYNRDNTAM